LSEYKTYKCDICGKLGAQHLYIQHVDYKDEPNEKREWIKGYFDTCSIHIQDILNILTDAKLWEDRRDCWQKILKLKSKGE